MGVGGYENDSEEKEQEKQRMDSRANFALPF